MTGCTSSQLPAVLLGMISGGMRCDVAEGGNIAALPVTHESGLQRSVVDIWEFSEARMYLASSYDGLPELA